MFEKLPDSIKCAAFAAAGKDKIVVNSAIEPLFFCHGINADVVFFGEFGIADVDNIGSKFIVFGDNGNFSAGDFLQIIS